MKLHFHLWKKLNQIVLNYNKPIPACLQIVPSGIAHWNKNKGYVDVMSRLLSHIKIPFKRADPVLQLIVRFTFILLVNGYITTQFTKYMPKSMFENDNITFDDIKNKLCQKSTLSEYVIAVARDFQIPSLRPYKHMTVQESPNQYQSNTNQYHNNESIFNNLPADRCLSEHELIQFAKIVDEKKRSKYQLFQKPGLARNIRLSNQYSHSNSKELNPKGIRCALCYHFLKQKSNSTTTKGCTICRVPLCSDNATKFESVEESCFWRWHNVSNFDTLTPPKIKEKCKHNDSTIDDTGIDVTQERSTSSPRRKRKR